MLQLKVCMRVCACVHVCVYVCVLSVAQLYLTLCDSIDLIIRQAPLSMGFSWQEYWNELPFPSPGHLPDPGDV